MTRAGRPTVPALIGAAGEKASRRFLEFFTAEIRNRNTRLTYGALFLNTNKLGHSKTKSE